MCIGVRLLLRFHFGFLFGFLRAGKRSDIDSWNLIQSVPEPRSRGCAGRQAIGVRLLLRFYFGCGRDGREISLLGLQVGTVTPPHPNSLDQGRFWGKADMDNLDFHVWRSSET